MEIDLVELTILATASIIGAVGVAIVWGTLTELFHIQRKALMSFAFLLAGSVAGIAFLYSPLLGVMAEPLVRILPDPIYFERALEVLPAFSTPC